MSTEHPALPPKVSRPWIASALLVWVVMSFAGVPEPDPLAPRTFRGHVTLMTDVFDGRYGDWAIGRLPDGPALLDFEEPVALGRGDVAEFSGTLGGAPGVAAGRSYGGVLDVQRVHDIETSKFLPHRAGMLVRTTVDEALQPYDDGRGLLAGFLIGDTSHIKESDVEAMRRSGLAHFVAVSGSNVALFLGLLAVVAGPLSLGPKRRAILGLAGLPVYVAATRFEPSVIRAAVMAGMALAGRLVGVVLEAWQLLSLAVVVLLLLDPSLTANVGFQLSVAATAGVLVGARWPLKGIVKRALAVTIGAQIAVAPLLLIHFDSVPMMSPVVNLVAAPLVTVSTLVGAVGVAGLGFLIGPASLLADLVLGLARMAAAWPQLGAVGLTVVILVAVGLVVVPRLRVVAVLPGAAILVVALVIPGADLPDGAVAVLDVGQGDAILINGGEGRIALVDGGPDPVRILSRLRDYGVNNLELVVLTHVHADHATGLAGIVGEVGIGTVWADVDPHETAASRALFAALAESQLGAVAPTVGQRVRLGELEVVVEGPVRRYASPNDQSIVLMVRGPRRSMLLSGDIETFAQADLKHLRADVLKVPHQGAGTSDADWLRGVGSSVAVISVGPNNFGHPVDWVIDTLAESGAAVLRTDEAGDVVVNLASP